MKILTIIQEGFLETVRVQNFIHQKITTQACDDSFYLSFLSKYLTGAFSRFRSDTLAVAFASVP